MHSGQRNKYSTRPRSGCEGDIKDEKEKAFTFRHCVTLIYGRYYVTLYLFAHPCTQTFVIVYDVTQRVSLDGVNIANLGEINQFSVQRNISLLAL